MKGSDAEPDRHATKLYRPVCWVVGHKHNSRTVVGSDGIEKVQPFCDRCGEVWADD
jgi:hypothetical protein